MRDCLSPELLAEMKATTDRAIMQAIESGPPPELRYSIGGSSASRQWFHDDAYCKIIDMPTTTPILEAIFGSSDYLVGGAGGDCALPGAVEYQSLHYDGIWQEPYDAQGKFTLKDYPVPVVTINFQMCDTDPTNGPIRQIPGTHHSHEPMPSLAEEPAWMKLSTVCPAPAGTGIFRDNRCWCARSNRHPFHLSASRSAVSGCGQARRHTQPLALPARDPEHRVLRPLVPLRVHHPLHALRELGEDVGARQAHRAAGQGAEGRGGARGRVRLEQRSGA